MKMLLAFASISIAFLPSTCPAGSLPRATWAVTESRDAYLECMGTSTALLADKSTIVEEATGPLENNQATHFYDPFAKNGTNHFMMEYESAKVLDERHLSVNSPIALSIRAFYHHRDYDDQDDNSPVVTAIERASVGQDFDTVHALALSESQIDPNLSPASFSNQVPKPGDAPGIIARREVIMKYFKEHALDSHKIVKGPFDDRKAHPKTEEEWAALQKEGSQAVCYQGFGLPIYDLSQLTPTDKYMYVLLYAGDGTSDTQGWKYKGAGEMDDFIALVQVPIADMLDQPASRFTFIPRKSSPQALPNFGVVFEVVDSSL